MAHKVHLGKTLDHQTNLSEPFTNGLLSKQLAQSYIAMVATCPLISGTIWQQVENDMFASKTGNEFSKDENDFIEFLRSYFSIEVIEQVSETIKSLKNSALGLKYTLRATKASIAARILHDIVDSNLHDIAQHGNEQIREAFRSIKKVNVSTSCGNANLKLTIRERGINFESNEAVAKISARVYDPFSSESAIVTLYHGCRSSSFEHFCKDGITPRFNVNEFSSEAAFYVSNSIIQAFEHPLHVHLKRDTSDLSCVIVFEIPTAVLHGEECPSGSEKPFQIKWFEQADDEWKNFCKKNLLEPIPDQNHSYDIVIGPPYMGYDRNDITVIAFCTKRSRQYLAELVSTVFFEK